MVCLALGALGVALLVRPVLVDGQNGATAGPKLTTVGGGAAPGFTLPRLADPAVTLSLARLHGRPVLINFWASWCVPCRAEMPRLERAYTQAGDKVAFVGIDTHDTRAAALAFMRQTRVTYPSAFDPAGSAAATYGLFGLPTSVFVLPDGRILERHVGELSPQFLQDAMAQLVASAAR